MPLISVLLPVYNGEKYLDAAIASIVRQTFGDFELLVLDDGSTDGSGAIADRWAAIEPRIRVIHRENRGLVVTLNELVNAAAGKYFARMDADDVALSDRLARQIQYLELQADVVCVGGSQLLIDEADRPIATIHALLDDSSIQSQALRGHGTICHPSAMMRAAAVKKLLGYRAEYFPAEDLDLWLRLGEIGRLANLPETIIQYRIHSQSISALAAQGRQRDAGRKVCEAAWVRRGLTGMVYEAGGAWRADDTTKSQYRFLLDYGWRALMSGYRQTAWVYGMRAIKMAPMNSSGWKLLLSVGIYRT